jgi:GT2 family glycosyltransferase
MKIITIIVTYNGSRYIRECLQCLRDSVDSTLNHTLLIDNDSKDDTRAIVSREFPEVELIESGANLGFGKANNIGLREALKRGAEYVFLLNQDAYVEPETIRRLYERAQALPEYGILSPMQLNGDGSAVDYTFNPYCVAAASRLVSDLVVRPTELDVVYPVYFTNAAAWFIPLAFLKTVGGFAPIYPHYGEDNDLINRCHFHGFKVGILPEISIRHDRPQQEKPPHEKSLTKITQEAYIRSLIILTNVGSGLSRALHLAFVRSVRNLIVGFHPKKLITEGWSGCRILKSFSEIMKTRKQCAQKSASYLS